MASVKDFASFSKWAAGDEDNSPPRPVASTEVEDIHSTEVVGDATFTEVVGTGSQIGSASRGISIDRPIPMSSPLPPQASKGKRVRSTEADPKERKKHKSKSHGHDRSPNIDLLGLGEEDCARFKEEPFEVIVDAVKAAGRLLKKFQDEETERLEGVRMYRKVVDLQDELSDKTDKLKTATDNLIELREENIRINQRLQTLEPKIKVVEETEEKLRAAERKLQEAETQVTAAVVARTAAEAANDKTLAEKVEAEAEVARVQQNNKELLGQVTFLKNSLDAMEREKNKFKERSKEVASKAVELARYSFENALGQAQLIHPDLKLDRAIVDVEHFVEGQEIIRPEKEEGGKIVCEQAVMFRAGRSD